eukprot:13697491-Alexandrium_andersonii.AAC.1
MLRSPGVKSRLRTTLHARGVLLAQQTLWCTPGATILSIAACCSFSFRASVLAQHLAQELSLIHI